MSAACSCGAHEVVDQAIAEGRSDVASRVEVERQLEATPALTAALLNAQPPDPLRAARNFYADEEIDRAYVEETTARLGLTKEEIR